MNLIAVEGITCSGKSSFCHGLIEKLEREYTSCVLKKFMGYSNMDNMMNRLVLQDLGNSIPTYMLPIIELYLYIEKEVSKSWMKEDIIVIERYIANLYARLQCSGISTKLLDIFEKYPAKLTLFIENDPEESFEIYYGKRAIAYWDTDFSNGLSIKEIKEDIVDFYRGKYSSIEIKKAFIRYQNSLVESLLEYARDRNCVKISKDISLEEKVNTGFEEIRKIMGNSGVNSVNGLNCRLYKNIS